MTEILDNPKPSSQALTRQTPKELVKTRMPAMLKVIAVTNDRIIGLVLLQTAVVGLIGYAIGIGLAAAFFEFSCTPTSALRGFILPWWIALGVAGVMMLLIFLSTVVSLKRVLFVEPAIVFWAKR